MSPAVRTTLVAAAGVALLVEAVGVAGWWAWRQTVRALDARPAEAAAMLAGSPWLELPPAVRRARRLPSRDLGVAADELVVPALAALAGRQVRWFPSDPEGFKNLARVDLIEGDLDAGAKALGRALTRDPTSPELHRLAAMSERARGRHPASLDHLATAEGLADGSGRGVVELGAEDAAWVRLEGLRRRLDLYPRVRVRGVLQLAGELRRRGDAEGGRELLEAEAGDPRIDLELARWDVEAGLTADGEARLDELLSRSGLTDALRAQAWSTTALARDQRGDADGALDAANRAIRYDPRSPAPYLVLAGLAERRGELDDALGHLRRAWGMNPTDVGLLVRVATTAERAGAMDDARLALERAAAVAPGDPALRARLVELHLRHGDLMEATVTLSEALDRFPTDSRLLALAERLRAEVTR
ncbi:MAG TPA: tetratricopeptide repeat protein [Candidatus Sulfomarinibacteraceae bacterium]|nr:tetratricopeptide repeat protein [Candidatus Sulfomarinibacteraceae bacterium]